MPRMVGGDGAYQLPRALALSGQEKLNEFVWDHGLRGKHPEWTIKDFVNWYIKVVCSEKDDGFRG